MEEFFDVAYAEHTFAEHEHRELQAGIQEIHEVAAEVGHTTPAGLAGSIRRIGNWVGTVLIPHAAWEDRVLYPEIDRIADTQWATKGMRFEHYQIERLAAHLADDVIRLESPLTHAGATDIRAHLFGLEAMIRSHIEREETFLMPMLAAEQEPPVEGATAGRSARPTSATPV